MFTDVAVAIGCGGRDLVDVEALHAQQQVLGPVASDTTAARALGQIGERRRAKIAAPTRTRRRGRTKGRSAWHLLACWIDNTGELASLLPRGGGAGSNTTTDLITVLGEAIAQVPKPYRRKLLITCDAAGASHRLIDWLVAHNHAANRNVEFSVRFDLDTDVRAAITAVRAHCRVPAVDNTDATVRGDADITEITTLLRDRLQRTG